MSKKAKRPAGSDRAAPVVSAPTSYQDPRAEKIKTAARGRWLEILTAAGMDAADLDGRNRPCPKCGGNDRFATFSDFTETGGVICRGCHSDKNSDGIATLINAARVGRKLLYPVVELERFLAARTREGGGA